MFVADAADPVWVTVAFQALVTFWSPGKVQVSVQPLIGVVPVLVTVRFAVNPPPHSFFTYDTWHAAPPVLPLLIVQVNDAEPDAPVESVAVTVTLKVPAALGVPVIRPEEEIDSPVGRPVAA